MIRTILALLGALPLVACTATPSATSSFASASRPVIATAQLVGRWEIAAVNRGPVQGYSMQFSPTAVQVSIACSSGAGGWSLSGGRIIMEPLKRPERDCTLPDTGPAPETIRLILSQPLEAELNGPDKLRLSNGVGTIDLIHTTAGA